MGRSSDYMALSVQVIDKKRLMMWAESLPATPERVTVLGGERLWVCDEAVVLELMGQIVGAGTIAPKGECGDPKPSIIAIYVVPEFRDSIREVDLLAQTIVRCSQRNLVPVRFDMISSRDVLAVNSLPEELRQLLDARSYGGIMDLLMDY